MIETCPSLNPRNSRWYFTCTVCGEKGREANVYCMGQILNTKKNMFMPFHAWHTCIRLHGSALQSTWRDMPRHATPCHAMTRHDMTPHDITWHDMPWHDTTGHHSTSHDMTWHDMAWHGMTWQHTKLHCISINLLCFTSLCFH